MSVRGIALERLDRPARQVVLEGRLDWLVKPGCGEDTRAAVGSVPRIRSEIS